VRFTHIFVSVDKSYATRRCVGRCGNPARRDLWGGGSGNWPFYLNVLRTWNDILSCG